MESGLSVGKIVLTNHWLDVSVISFSEHGEFMNFMDSGLLFGFSVVLLDFLAWRFLRLKNETARVCIRTLLFLALSYVLWSYDLSPLHVAPWAGNPVRHIFAQGLELLWWLQAAQIGSFVLARVVLSPELHREHLFQDILRAIVFMIAAVAAVAYVLELPIGGLLATSGALAIILGLALQSTLSDVFSGVVLNATQPFHLGDTVTIGDIQGEVIERNWRATTLLNGQGNFVVVPNSAASKANIVNESRPPQMHGLSITIRISPRVRPARVIAALTDAIESTVGVLDTPKAVISAHLMHTKFIEYEILAYVASIATRSATQNEIMDQAYRHLNAHGVELGHPPIDGLPPNHSERLLRGIDMFRALSDVQFSELAKELEHEEFSAGEMIYQAGPDCPDERRALYIVATGVAALLTPFEGHDIELRRLSPGDAVGRAGILTGVSKGIKLRAISKVAIARLCKDAITPILQQHPEVAKAMLASLIAYQTRESEVLSELPTPVVETSGIFARLLAGMRRLHGIASQVE
jgi:small-conductance mechanosensitive channel/CRP-like cAMP-binding protein